MFALNTKKLLTLVILFAAQATMIATTINRNPIPAFRNLNHTETMVSFPVNWNVDTKIAVPFASVPILDVILMSIHGTSTDIYHETLVQWNQFAIKTQTFMIVDVGESVKTLFHDVKLAAKDSYDEVAPKWNLFHEKTHDFMIDALKSIQLYSSNVQSIARAATKNWHDCTTSKIKIFDDKIPALIPDAFVTSAITFGATLALQSTILMIIASTMASFLLRVPWTLCRGMILHQAMTQNVHCDRTGKIFDMDLSNFDYDYEVTNVFVPFDPIDFLCSVNDGIALSGSCTVESQFIGPAFSEMRDAQSEFDDDDESTDDFDAQMQDLLGSSYKISFKGAISSADTKKSVSDSEMDDLVHSFAKLSFQDGIETRFIGHTFAKMRDPHDELDDDDESTNDLDTQMDELLGSFSKPALTDGTAKKTVSDSEMDDLVNSFANF